MKNLIFLIFVIAPSVGVSQNFENEREFNNLDSALEFPSRTKSLRLDSDDINEINPSITRLTNLESLSLSYNPGINLVDLFNKLAKLPKLSFLNLSGCQIEILPSNISKLSHLKRLVIGNNKLTVLPPEIKQLPKLKELIFSQYPDDFRKLTKEQKLQMLSLLPCTKILLTEYFGGEHGYYRLGAEMVRVTKDNLWPNN